MIPFLLACRAVGGGGLPHPFFSPLFPFLPCGQSLSPLRREGLFVLQKCLLCKVVPLQKIFIFTHFYSNKSYSYFFLKFQRKLKINFKIVYNSFYTSFFIDTSFCLG
jgi:hypothetical protein